MNDKEQKVSESPQGANGAVLTPGQIQVMVKRDLRSCILLLQACHDDQDVLAALSTFLHGKYMNERHKKDLAAQTELVP